MTKCRRLVVICLVSISLKHITHVICDMVASQSDSFQHGCGHEGVWSFSFCLVHGCYLRY